MPQSNYSLITLCQVRLQAPFPLHQAQARSLACVSRVAKFFLEESHGTKSESLRHTIHCQNSMENMCARTG